MDQVDLISEVYTKGEILIQTVSDPMKTRLENQLAEFENDWAEFCGSVTECNHKIQEDVERQEKQSDWEEFTENSENITSQLKHFERLLNEVVPDEDSIENVSQKLLKIQVEPLRDRLNYFLGILLITELFYSIFYLKQERSCV